MRNQVYWYHSCTGINLVTGFVQMIINGHLIVDQVLKEFKGTADVRPRNLRGNLLLGKMWLGFWYQGRQKVTNLNIYGGILTKEEMVEKTFGSGCGVADGDFLSWDEMEWTVHGSSRMITVDQKDFCKKYSNIILFTSPFLEQDLCREHCLKMNRGWMAPVSTKEEGDRLLKRMTDVMVDPETGNVYEGMDGMSAWLPISDVGQEGTWVDKRTGESPQAPMWLPGK